jgi:hypothetical protein
MTLFVPSRCGRACRYALVGRACEFHNQAVPETPDCGTRPIGLGVDAFPRDGLERSRHARWTHGVYSEKAKAILRESRRRWRELLALLS